ncbi:MAG: 50S ribosomal protein L15 [Candidatus Aenigmarchaeota archaeon CG_4_10_14_0_8_um_filter_37_24]|nr:50S ribosomal protein L15 [Candidatus Aenigmarchaeota archaeon]OIN88532.1 MAG: 50S ribosomal protein L15 [Candidatus Aenigmarchaeota archaeon CG1_02_38_14]PIV68874.1 MAG: 50S ribosomal protein L15 [Candidatus Aenigmarchaeota archaeon CG01_land_8_20_14_3_00_37_9]PIW41079.1 MAG: 50S ribosomal protein L15 [Candidatus Aenigmarchaeota archaeon CG15_BIG_FIL_POST_REV_8_21_14_020_37_27]PIX50928.1 MAG: 50S ribosomal protein L15 [Candidatus Aenigmarchaeota archaeon CG_4_8_14_3_um_filter_37_24]PIY3575
MVVKRTKKILKKRGHRTVGYGAGKKHRGSGSRGGVGMAGLHKHKRMRALKYMPDHFGKRGFKRPQKMIKIQKIINIKQLDPQIDKLLKEKKIQKEKDTFIVKLDDLGYDKLLGTGKLNHKLIIEAKAFSESAIKKIEESGGKTITV